MVKAGVLALQGDVREHLAMIAAAGATPVAVKRADEIADVDALVVPGGESTTIGLMLHRFGLLEPVRARIYDGLPVLGTCAGLILMATEVRGRHGAPHRLGVLDVSVRRNAYGRQTESFEADVDVAGLDGPVRAAFIRAPVIERVGDGVDVLAVHDQDPVVVAAGRLIAATFHPELSGDCRLHRLLIERAA